MTSYMTRIKDVYGEKFVCHKCGRDAMFMDSDKKWYCSFNMFDLKEHHKKRKNDKNK